MNKFGKLLIPMLALLILGSVMVNAQEFRLGVGTNFTFPEVSSYDAQLVGDFSLGNQISFGPVIPFLRGEASVASLLGTRIITTAFSLCLDYSLDGIGTIYGGGGMGIVSTSAGSYGTMTSTTFHGLVGIRAAMFDSQLPVFVQSKLKTYPLGTTNTILELSMGILYQL